MYQRGGSLSARVSVIAVVLAALQVSSTHGNCPASYTTYASYGSPDNCQDFNICVFGSPFPMSCPDTLHFNEDHGVCVHAYGYNDICATKNAARECASGSVTRALAHPTDCRRFYVCSDATVPESGSSLGQYEQECPGTRVFDVFTATCVPYSPEVCGSRVSPVSDGSFYSFTAERGNFAENLAACGQRGGTLAEIESESEDDFIAGYLSSLGIEDRFVYIGGHDLDGEGDFRWEVSEANFNDYTNWGPNQPNNHGGMEDCLAVSQINDWRWFDQPCRMNFFGLCEIKLPMENSPWHN